MPKSWNFNKDGSVVERFRLISMGFKMGFRGLSHVSSVQIDLDSCLRLRLAPCDYMALSTSCVQQVAEAVKDAVGASEAIASEAHVMCCSG